MARQNQSAAPADNRMSIGRLAVALLFLCLIAALFYRYYKNNFGSYTLIPKELQINYKPSEFDLNVDEEDALAILSNPQRYRREFNQLVYDVNMSIVNHTANRMGLSAEIKAKAKEEYEKHHTYLKDLYYNDFIEMKDTTSNLYETWYDNESTNAVSILNTVASKYTCFLVNHVLSSLIETTKDGSIFARGKSVDTPCGVAMTEALQPLIKRLEDRAAIEDFSRSRGLMQEKVERVIAELATVEVQDKKGLNRQLQTKIWGFSVSSTDFEVTAISILKAGFKLNEYFDIKLNANAGLVTITLPAPTILSHEVYPKIDKLDIGWLREVKNVDLNRSFNVLRAEFRRDAIEESQVLDKAKAQAVELMTTMFGPVINGMNKRYKIKVQFREAPTDDYEEEQSKEFTSSDPDQASVFK
ncbi:MAG: DUF4230 domain-containing protein [Saprospiraceae bacterium]|nr:DUF4230 domain-containing protein [Saprospiraceae bacterium]